MAFTAASDQAPLTDPGHGNTPPGARGAQPAGKYVAASAAAVAKILIVGPLGVGKTTFISTVSEIPPLSTDAAMTRAGVPADGALRTAKRTTTVALDFGRLTLGRPGDELVLYLFGTPGQQRFLPAWRDLAKGAVGALALIDTADLSAAFEALDNLEELNLPFAVAANTFPHSPAHPAADLRSALDLLPHTPLLECDARDNASCIRALIALVNHLINRES
ncbi:ATP/GTP-binding protein [Streptomyces sp. NPDC059740]|uniref:GTP-binding protein n=1 Tax=Streptomyces sp. NPDC059740 TaxID=3346926 RepID=UPI0036584D46